MREKINTFKRGISVTNLDEYEDTLLSCYYPFEHNQKQTQTKKIYN